MKEAVKTLQKWTDSWVIGKTEYMWDGGSDEDLDVVHASLRTVLTALTSATARAEAVQAARAELDAAVEHHQYHIDPIARCPHCNTTYTWRDEKWYSPVRIQQHCGCPRNWTCAVCNKAVLTPADFAEYEKNGAHVECAREEMYGTKHFPPPLTQAEKEELETEERWGLPPSARCKVCGAVCDIYPDPPEQGTCYEHCEDHYFQVVDREARCYHCNQPAPDDWYDSEDV